MVPATDSDAFCVFSSNVSPRSAQINAAGLSETSRSEVNFWL
jgi:hypothetical protein